MRTDDNDIFGRLFDFNGDGKTTMDEEFLAFMMWEEAQKKEQEKRKPADANDSDPFDDMDLSLLSCLHRG